MRQSDQAGNLGAADTSFAAFTVDTSITAAGSLLPALAPGQDTGSSGDNLTNLTQPTIRVSFTAANSQVGDVITISRPNGNSSSVIGSASISSDTDLSNGYIDVALTAPLAEGSTVLTAQIGRAHV